MTAHDSRGRFTSGGGGGASRKAKGRLKPLPAQRKGARSQTVAGGAVRVRPYGPKKAGSTTSSARNTRTMPGTAKGGTTKIAHGKNRRFGNSTIGGRGRVPSSGRLRGGLRLGGRATGKVVRKPR